MCLRNKVARTEIWITKGSKVLDKNNPYLHQTIPNPNPNPTNIFKI